MTPPRPPAVVYVSWCPHGHVLCAASAEDSDAVRSLTGNGTCDACPPSLRSRKRVTRYRLDDPRGGR